MSNKLNDIQAAAYFKDQKIKKLLFQEDNLKKKEDFEVKELKSNFTQLKKVEEESNLIKLKYEKANKVITEQNSTIQNMLQKEKTDKSNFELKIGQANSEHAKKMADLQRTLDGKQIMFQDE